ncbi:MAG: HU family DNA-binding protein [Planctomycetes bacterium]|nr:HU family DNA-binding protein [Planctomycetota bacterium]
MATVTKKELVMQISKRTQSNVAEVQDVIHALFEVVNQHLGQGNRIELRDFGVFDFKRRAARTGHNPRTLEKVQVKEKVVVTFRMGKKMKEAIGPLASKDGSATPPGSARPGPSAAPSGKR